MSSGRILLLAALLAYVAYRWNKNLWNVQLTEFLEEEYDYIIVGSGPSGSVLASRLSETPSVKVLLVEAGGTDVERRSEITTPYSALSLQASSELVLNDTTTSQKHACQSMKDKRCRLLTPRVLGGESSVGCMTYSLGCSQQYDDWRLPGWSYKDLQAYFENGELQEGKPEHVQLTFSDVRATSLSEALVIAGKSLSFKPLEDHLINNLGVTPAVATTDRGSRVSVVKSYLSVASKRSNLHVLINTIVSKVILENRVAKGVELLRGKDKIKVKAKREVILSAGTLDSAQLLMLSGIGPKEELTKYKIPIITDLPVGQHVQDHLSVLASQYLLDEPIAMTEYKASSFWAYMDYTLFGTGFLSSTCHREGSLYLHSSSADGKIPKCPDTELLLMNTVVGNSPKLQATFAQLTNMDKDVVKSIYGNADMLDGFSLASVLLKPKSRGRIHLQSDSVLDRPVLDGNYLSDPHDVKVLIEGIHQASRLINTDMFKALGPKQLKLKLDKCEQLKKSSSNDEYLECFVRNTAYPLSRSVASCPMGSNTDSTSVVDTELRVHGITGLRVVDASVLPQSPSSALDALLIVMAERAADLITGRIRFSPQSTVNSTR